MGLVLTAAHVTSKVDEEIKVIMEDGREFHGSFSGAKFRDRFGNATNRRRWPVSFCGS